MERIKKLNLIAALILIIMGLGLVGLGILYFNQTNNLLQYDPIKHTFSIPYFMIVVNSIIELGIYAAALFFFFGGIIALFDLGYDPHEYDEYENKKYIYKGE